MIYLITLIILYVALSFASLLEKISAYRFAVRYESVSRSRETLREMKELKIKVKSELVKSIVWPVEVWKLLKKDGK